MGLGPVDVIVLLSHPVVGTFAAYVLYRQWTSLRSLKNTSRISERMTEIKLNHQEQGERIGLLLGVTILLAIIVEGYRGWVLGVPLSGLISLHGWLGILLFCGAMVMRRTGRKIVNGYEEHKSTKQQKNTHSKFGGAMMWLLVMIVFLGFLRLLQVLS